MIKCGNNKLGGIDMEYRPLFSPRRSQKERKMKDDLDYFREAARYYYQMGDDKFVIRVGKKKLAIGNEQKKLLALYLATSIYGNSGEIRRKVADFPAFKIFESTFKECAIRRDISDDVISGIVSQEFSEFFKLNRGKEYSIPELIILQTKRVADANEVNPLYWMCKTSDNVNGTNFAEKFVDNINWFYYKSGRQGGPSEKPWERSDIEKMVSIEKSSILGMLFGNRTSTKRVRQETEHFQQDRKNGVVEHRKLNKEAATESKQVDEEQKSSVDVELSEIDRWQKANQVVNDFLKEIIPESEWSRIKQEGVMKARELGMMDFLYGLSSNVLLSAEYVEKIANIKNKSHEEALRRLNAAIAGEKFVPDDTSSRIDNGDDPEADKTLFAIIDTVTDGNSKVSQELLNLIKEYGGNYYPQYPGICILADCVRLYKENGCDLNEVLSGRGNKLAENNFLYILMTIKKIEEMPRKSLAQVTSMDEPLKWHHENNPVPKNYYSSISKTRKSRTYASDTIKSTTTSSSSSSSLGTSDSSELGRMLGESTGGNSKSNDMGRHF